MNKNSTNKETKMVTNSYKSFLISYNNIVGLIGYITGMMSRIIEVQEVAYRALKEGAEIVGEKYEGEPPPNKKEHPIRKTYDYYLNLMLEIMLCRTVEAYLYYVNSILSEIFEKKPSLLKSSETVKLEEILSHKSIKSFIKYQIEQKIIDLSYKSFDDINEYIYKKLKLKLVENDKTDKIIEAIEIRNISVHNNCIINKKYLNKIKNTKELCGRKKELKLEYIFDLLSNIDNSAKIFDKSAIDKYKLETEKIEKIVSDVEDEKSQKSK